MFRGYSNGGRVDHDHGFISFTMIGFPGTLLNMLCPQKHRHKNF